MPRMPSALRRRDVVAAALALSIGASLWPAGGEARTALVYPFAFTAPGSAPGNGAHACKPVVPPMTDVGDLLSVYRPDSTQSVVDPDRQKAYSKRTWKAVAFTRSLHGMIADGMADPSRRPAIGRCILRHLRVWADKGALLSGHERNDVVGRRQAVMLAAWSSVVAANAYAAAQEFGAGRSEADRVILAWFGDIAARIVSEFTPPAEGRPEGSAWLDRTNNHRYWAAAAVALLAIHLEDDAAFHWSMRTLRKALGGIPEDGGLPAELRRGRKAAGYQNFAVKALVITAAAARANGNPIGADEWRRLLAAAEVAAGAHVDRRALEARLGRTLEPVEPHNIAWAWLLAQQTGGGSGSVAAAVAAGRQPDDAFAGLPPGVRVVRP